MPTTAIKTVTTIVISYSRWSSKMQGSPGKDSERRQREKAERWTNERGLTIADDLSDRGISAFSGRNSKSGALSEFLSLVENGNLPNGTILLVESVDRLSRLKPLEAIKLVSRILERGIKIVTMIDGMEYTEASVNNGQIQILLSLLMRAYDESRTKSDRLKEMWEQRRKNIADKPMTGNLPCWLYLKGDKIEIDRERAAIVKRLFKMSIDGNGFQRIAATINSEGLKLSKDSDFLQPYYVSRLLANRAVLGELQPCIKVTVNGKTERKPIGETVPNYFPRIIDDKTFYAARKSIQQRYKTGGRSKERVNVFSGIVFDAEDGSPLYVKGKNKGKVRFRHFISSLAYTGINGVNHGKHLPVFILETGFYQHFGNVLAEMLTNSESKTKRDNIASLEARLAEIETRVDEINSEAADAGSVKAVVGLLAKLETRRQAIADQLEQERQDTAYDETVSLKDYLDKWETIQRLAVTGVEDNDERVLIRGLLRRYIARMDVETLREGTRREPVYAARVRLTWHNGEQTQFAIIGRAKCIGHKVGIKKGQPGWGKSETKYTLTYCDE